MARGVIVVAVVGGVAVGIVAVVILVGRRGWRRRVRMLVVLGGRGMIVVMLVGVGVGMTGRVSF